MTDEVIETTAIVVHDATSRMADVVTINDMMLNLRRNVFEHGVDFDTIPGTQKPSLLLPGMEKILRAMRLRPEYVPLDNTVVDFDKPLFYFEYECRLYDVDTNVCWSTAIGSCNSYEAKYRWREGKRLCPSCGKETIFKGKADKGGGWYCWTRQGGCGATFKDGDASIEEQVVGKVLNENVFDQVNTIKKIAQKRALATAVKTVSGVSSLFTVDVEDFAEERPRQTAKSSPVHKNDVGSDAPDASLGVEANRTLFFEQLREATRMTSTTAMQILRDAGHTDLRNLTRAQAMAILSPSEESILDNEMPF